MTFEDEVEIMTEVLSPALSTLNTGDTDALSIVLIEKLDKDVLFQLTNNLKSFMEGYKGC